MLKKTSLFGVVCVLVWLSSQHSFCCQPNGHWRPRAMAGNATTLIRKVQDVLPMPVQ